jgi:hypothetical protein
MREMKRKKKDGEKGSEKKPTFRGRLLKTMQSGESHVDVQMNIVHTYKHL